jgi:hypothetical protein
MPQIGDLVMIRDDWVIIIDKSGDTNPEILFGVSAETEAMRVFTEDDIIKHGVKNDFDK